MHPRRVNNPIPRVLLNINEASAEELADLPLRATVLSTTYFERSEYPLP